MVQAESVEAVNGNGTSHVKPEEPTTQFIKLPEVGVTTGGLNIRELTFDIDGVLSHRELGLLGETEKGTGTTRSREPDVIYSQWCKVLTAESQDPDCRCWSGRACCRHCSDQEGP